MIGKRRLINNRIEITLANASISGVTRVDQEIEWRS